VSVGGVSKIRRINNFRKSKSAENVIIEFRLTGRRARQYSLADRKRFKYHPFVANVHGASLQTLSDVRSVISERFPPVYYTIRRNTRLFRLTNGRRSEKGKTKRYTREGIVLVKRPNEYCAVTRN